jgi:RNA polymerase sigma factor (sigma-70 family)
VHNRRPSASARVRLSDSDGAAGLKKVGLSRVIEGVETERAQEQATVEVLGNLYRRGYHTYLRLAEAIVGEAELAHDVVQDAFARALRSRSDFRGTGSLEGWVWRTVVNAARTTRRDRPPVHMPLLEHGDASVATNGDVPRGDVRALIAALPERQRLMLFLRYYADLDYARIADVLEVQPGTVGATLNQAHAALRTALEGVPK